MLRIFTQRCREINSYCRGIAQQALSGFGFGAFDRVVVKNDLLQVEGCQRIISMFCKQGCVTEQCQKLSVCWALVNSIGARRAMMSSVSSSQLQLRDSTLQVPGSSDLFVSLNPVLIDHGGSSLKTPCHRAAACSDCDDRVCGHGGTQTKWERAIHFWFLIVPWCLSPKKGFAGFPNSSAKK